MMISPGCRRRYLITSWFAITILALCTVQVYSKRGTNPFLTRPSRNALDEASSRRTDVELYHEAIDLLARGQLDEALERLEETKNMGEGRGASAAVRAISMLDSTNVTALGLHVREWLCEDQCYDWRYKEVTDSSIPSSFLATFDELRSSSVMASSDRTHMMPLDHTPGADVIYAHEVSRLVTSIRDIRVKRDKRGGMEDIRLRPPRLIIVARLARGNVQADMALDELQKHLGDRGLRIIKAYVQSQEKVDTDSPSPVLIFDDDKPIFTQQMSKHPILLPQFPPLRFQSTSPTPQSSPTDPSASDSTLTPSSTNTTSTHSAPSSTSSPSKSTSTTDCVVAPNKLSQLQYDETNPPSYASATQHRLHAWIRSKNGFVNDLIGATSLCSPLVPITVAEHTGRTTPQLFSSSSSSLSSSASDTNLRIVRSAWHSVSPSTPTSRLIATVTQFRGHKIASLSASTMLTATFARDHPAVHNLMNDLYYEHGIDVSEASLTYSPVSYQKDRNRPTPKDVDHIISSFDGIAGEAFPSSHVTPRRPLSHRNRASIPLLRDAGWDLDTLSLSLFNVVVNENSRKTAYSCVRDASIHSELQQWYGIIDRALLDSTSMSLDHTKDVGKDDNDQQLQAQLDTQFVIGRQPPSTAPTTPPSPPSTSRCSSVLDPPQNPHKVTFGWWKRLFDSLTHTPMMIARLPTTRAYSLIHKLGTTIDSSLSGYLQSIPKHETRIAFNLDEVTRGTPFAYIIQQAKRRQDPYIRAIISQIAIASQHGSWLMNEVPPSVDEIRAILTETFHLISLNPVPPPTYSSPLSPSQSLRALYIPQSHGAPPTRALLPIFSTTTFLPVTPKTPFVLTTALENVRKVFTNKVSSDNMSSQSQIIETLITAVKSQVDLGAETPSVELQATSSPPSASGVVTRGHQGSHDPASPLPPFCERLPAGHFAALSFAKVHPASSRAQPVQRPTSLYSSTLVSSVESTVSSSSGDAVRGVDTYTAIAHGLPVDPWTDHHVTPFPLAVDSSPHMSSSSSNETSDLVAHVDALGETTLLNPTPLGDGDTTHPSRLPVIKDFELKTRLLPLSLRYLTTGDAWSSSSSSSSSTSNASLSHLTLRSIPFGRAFGSLSPLQAKSVTPLSVRTFMLGISKPIPLSLKNKPTLQASPSSPSDTMSPEANEKMKSFKALIESELSCQSTLNQIPILPTTMNPLLPSHDIGSLLSTLRYYLSDVDTCKSIVETIHSRDSLLSPSQSSSSQSQGNVIVTACNSDDYDVNINVNYHDSINIRSSNPLIPPRPLSLSPLWSLDLGINPSSIDSELKVMKYIYAHSDNALKAIPGNLANDETEMAAISSDINYLQKRSSNILNNLHGLKEVDLKASSSSPPSQSPSTDTLPGPSRSSCANNISIALTTFGARLQAISIRRQDRLSLLWLRSFSKLASHILESAKAQPNPVATLSDFDVSLAFPELTSHLTPSEDLVLDAYVIDHVKQYITHVAEALSPPVETAADSSLSSASSSSSLHQSSQNALLDDKDVVDDIEASRRLAGVLAKDNTFAMLVPITATGERAGDAREVVGLRVAFQAPTHTTLLTESSILNLAKLVNGYFASPSSG